MIDSVSVIIPAFNEEGNINAAIDSVLYAVKDTASDFEVLIINDGSTDKTGQLATARAKTDPRIRVFSNTENRGFGYSFARGVKLCTKTFTTVFPGDNDMAAESLKNLILEMGKRDAEIITSFMKPNKIRSLFRRLMSKAFVGFMNLLFGLNLQYYNGAFICKTELLKSIPIRSEGLTALAECQIRLLRAGHLYRAISFEHTGRKNELSKAFHFKNILNVWVTIFVLFRDIYWFAAKTKIDQETELWRT